MKSDVCISPHFLKKKGIPSMAFCTILPNLTSEHALTATPLSAFIQLSVGDLSHIQFLAVEEKYRDEGYGSQILNEIKSRYNGNRIIVDMEDPDEEAKNHLQRMKRAHFYKENGFVDDGIRYCWHDQNFSILIWNGKLDYDEFVYFWERYDDEPGTLSKLHIIH